MNILNEAIFLCMGAGLLGLGFCLNFMMEYRMRNQLNKNNQKINEQQIAMNRIQAEREYVKLEHEEKMTKLEHGED